MSGKYVFTKGLKELRFLFCQTSEHSAPTRCVRRYDFWSSMAWDSQITPNRTFLQRAYPTMKKHNPHVPILIREASGTLPKVYARYAFGKETLEPLNGLSDAQIEEKLTKLVKESS
ncbi:hypothetical protein APSETT445_003297 [Aspergillus pseudonomiae]